ncbi:FxDxF family PEP-CTERM protein [Duganella sp. PWIR1]
MNKKLNAVALAFLLASSSLALAAAPPQGPGVVTLTNTSGNSWTAAIGDVVDGGNFIDVFTFSPLTSAGAYAAVRLVSTSFDGADGITFTSVDLNGTLLTLSGTTEGDTVTSWAKLLKTPVSGLLTLTVKGNSMAGGSYGGNITVTMVPEPATYGMMIGGLGILAMFARRRKE